MGLFSSKYYYSAYAGSKALHEEPPYTLQKAVLGEVLGGGNNGMGETILYAMQTDEFARARSLMRYAGTGEDTGGEKGYVRGYPTSNQVRIRVDQTILDQALLDAVGPYDSILRWHAGTMREEFILFKMMDETIYAGLPWPAGAPAENWDERAEDVAIPVVNPDTGQYYRASPLFDYDRFIIGLDPEDLWDIYGPDDYFDIVEDNSEYKLSFAYVDKDGADQVYQVPGTFDISDYGTGNYIQVKYDVGGDTRYWYYLIGSGLDPVLEANIDTNAREDQYLPVIVLMQDKHWYNEDPESRLAKSTNRISRLMTSTNAHKIRNDFEAAEEENPTEGGEKWDFYLHYGVPIWTQYQGSLEYLWHFFSGQKDFTQHEPQAYYDYLASGGSQPISELHITEGGVNGYNVFYRWSFIDEKEFPGTYSFTRTVGSEITRDPENPDFRYPGDVEETEVKELKEGELWGRRIQLPQNVAEQGDYREIIEAYYGPGTDIGTWGEDPEESGYHDFYLLTWQEENSYKQILVMGLSMQYQINTSTEANDYRFRYAIPEMFGTEEEIREFRIPVQWAALNEVQRVPRDEVLGDAKCATVFLVQVQKVKWYQTGFFKWLIIIIAIVIIIYFWYNPQFVAEAAALIAGATSGALYVLVYAALTFAIGWIISTAAQNLGGWAGQLLLIAYAVTMFNVQGGWQGIQDAWQNLGQDLGWMNAVLLLKSIDPVMKIGLMVYNAYQLNELEDEMRDYMKTERDRQIELQEAYDFYGPKPDYLDPSDLVSIYVSQPGESAAGYLGRTMNQTPGNIGYSAVNNFTEMALSLPRDPNQWNPVGGIFVDMARQRGVA